jgi:polysaccharide export outer membrane protein
MRLGSFLISWMRTSKSGHLLSSTLVLGCLCSGQEMSQSAPKPGQPAAGTIAPQPWFQQKYPRYLVRSVDTLELTFQFSPQFNQTVSVQPDGYVNLKGIGEIHVAGLTVPQITESLKAAYGKFLREPEMFLVLRDFEKPFVTVGGQVSHPGRYELRGDTTLAEVIQMAGGFNSASKHSQVVLFRKVSEEWAESKLVDVKKMLAHKDLREDVHLNPGDMIFVPQNKISKMRQYLPITVANATMNPAQL